MTSDTDDYDYRKLASHTEEEVRQCVVRWRAVPVTITALLANACSQGWDWRNHNKLTIVRLMLLPVSPHAPVKHQFARSGLLFEAAMDCMSAHLEQQRKTTQKRVRAVQAEMRRYWRHQLPNPKPV